MNFEKLFLIYKINLIIISDALLVIPNIVFGFTALSVEININFTFLNLID